jgi:hypothetical protein
MQSSPATSNLCQQSSSLFLSYIPAIAHALDGRRRGPATRSGVTNADVTPRSASSIDPSMCRMSASCGGVNRTGTAGRPKALPDWGSLVVFRLCLYSKLVYTPPPPACRKRKWQSTYYMYMTQRKTIDQRKYLPKEIHVLVINPTHKQHVA